METLFMKTERLGINTDYISYKTSDTYKARKGVPQQHSLGETAFEPYENRSFDQLGSTLYCQ